LVRFQRYPASQPPPRAPPPTWPQAVRSGIFPEYILRSAVDPIRKISLFGESRRSLGIVQSLSGKLHGKENQYSENFCYPLLLPDFCRKAVLFFFLLVCSAKGYRTFSIHHFASLFLSSCLPENFSFFSYRHKKLGALAFDD